MLSLMCCSCCLIYCSKLRYRLENVYKTFCWYKWLFWVCEWCMLPLLFNVVWLANCEFYTARDAITLANCKQDGNHWPNIQFICMAVAFFIVIAYNMVLVYLIQSAKISSEFHEYQLKKKEVEAVLNINVLWRINKFFTFSSYRSGVLAMYHRIYFNLFAVLLCLLEVSMVSIASISFIFVLGS